MDGRRPLGRGAAARTMTARCVNSWTLGKLGSQAGPRRHGHAHGMDSRREKCLADLSCSRPADTSVRHAAGSVHNGRSRGFWNVGSADRSMRQAPRSTNVSPKRSYQGSRQTRPPPSNVRRGRKRVTSLLTVTWKRVRNGQRTGPRKSTRPRPASSPNSQWMSWASRDPCTPMRSFLASATHGVPSALAAAFRKRWKKY